MEEWKEVKGHPNYKISSEGRLWSNKSKKYMATECGVVILDGQPISFPTLMAEHFLEGYDQSKMVYRKNKDINNWAVDNLEMTESWSYNYTQEARERIRDGWAKKNGFVIGYNGDKVIKARSLREIAQLIGIPKSTVINCYKNDKPTKNGWFFVRYQE